MKSLLRAVACAAAALAPAVPALAQILDTRAVPTYESVGLYWSNPGTTAAVGCQVQFRKVGELAFTPGLDMWFDARNNECRGSLVHLSPDTSYEAKMTVPLGLVPPVRTVVFKTWANQVPVASTVTVQGRTTMLDITQGGSALTGYRVYQAANGAVLDGQDTAQYNVYINASYVVLRGFVMRGAQQHAIRIAPDVTDVIIEDNDISGWGRPRGNGLGVNADSAVYAFCNSSSTLTRVTIQRNEIHDPRYTTNSWSDGHPEGPQAITMEYCPGNHVIRHNEIFSTTGRYFNDIISGSDNFSTTGFPNADSDIYGNELSHAWDDAIEAEGGNRNVRIWGNYMDRTGTGIASTVTSVGPLYLFRNVYNRSRMLAKVPLDQDDRQAMFKAGSDATLGDGRRYVFHNTMLQAVEAGAVYRLGGSAGVSGTGSTKLIHNTVTRNNIWHLWRPWEAIYDEGPDNDFGYDMYNGSPGAPIVNGILATPFYASGHGWQSESGGQYQLQPGTPGYDQGARIANFNDAFIGLAPDIGAHEGGSAAMKFGVDASPGPVVQGYSATTASPPPTSFPLTVSKAGAGSGDVTSSPAGINCGTTCSASFAAGSTVTLTASATTGSSFSGWSGEGCNGSGSCTLTMSAARAVTATFASSPPSNPPRLANIATRAVVLTGSDVMIAGLIIGGSAAKTVVVNVAGPSLASAGVAGVLADPTLTLVRSSDGAIIAANDNWQGAPNAAQIQASGFAPANSLEPAIMMTLAPGAYTAIVQGAGGGTGVALVGVFEVDHPEVPLINIATRGQVRTGDQVMIGGFIIQGDGPQTIVVRATGPSLTAAGVPGALADPVLQIFSGQTLVASNDDWRTAANAAALQASGFAPSDDRESAVLITLDPGAYTAIVSGKGGTTGVGIVEVFAR